LRSIAPQPKFKAENSDLLPTTPVINVQSRADALSQKVAPYNIKDIKATIKITYILQYLDLIKYLS
jgi:hypothetical protein